MSLPGGVVLKWTPARPQAVIHRRAVKGMRRATGLFAADVQEVLRRPQKRRRTAGGHWVGLEPSKPGEPPKMVIGQYIDSINTKLEVNRGEIVGYVGSDLPRAAALEFGNKKGTLEARPHLRPTAVENEEKYRREIEKTIENG